MALQNRVTPLSEIVATPLRGAWLGNRGILHDAEGRIRRFQATNAWIICRLSFKERHRELLQPGQYTHLFFHDEAVALAAGHRPCAECRRPDYRAFGEAWATGNEGSRPAAVEINGVLQAERLVPFTRDRRFHDADWRSLPAGTFVRLRTGPALVLADHLAHWTLEGYVAWSERPGSGTASVITPPSTVRAIAAGYLPQIDRSAAGPTAA